jgi:hypothetical protein
MKTNKLLGIALILAIDSLVTLGILAICTDAHAEDTKAKVGTFQFEETYRSVDLDAPGVVEVSSVACAVVNHHRVKCVTTDGLTGAQETSICRRVRGTEKMACEVISTGR